MFVALVTNDKVYTSRACHATSPHAIAASLQKKNLNPTIIRKKTSTTFWYHSSMGTEVERIPRVSSSPFSSSTGASGTGSVAPIEVVAASTHNCPSIYALV